MRTLSFWLGIKYGLAAFGAVLWLTLWFERGFWLGVIQLALLTRVAWDELIVPPPVASDREAPL